MKSLVIYGSRSGNTQKIAEAIADGLRTRGAVELLAVDEAPRTFAEGTDLVVIGGPTEGHRMTDPIVRFFDAIGTDGLQGIAAAAFDTRLHWPRWLSGSAAEGIEQRLRRSGARMIAPAESFIVSKEPALEPGETERARKWATSLADKVEARTPTTAGTR